MPRLIAVCYQDELSAEDVFVSCGAASDSEFKKISLAASKLGLRKPSRAVTTATTHCLVDSSRDSLQVCTRLGHQSCGPFFVLDKTAEKNEVWFQIRLNVMEKK